MNQTVNESNANPGDNHPSAAPVASTEPGRSVAPPAGWMPRGLALAALIVAVAPFVITVRMTSTSSSGGRVTSFTSLDPIAIVAGASAVVLAVIIGVRFARGRTRGHVNLVATIAALVLGGYHIVSGLGVLGKPTGGGRRALSGEAVTTTVALSAGPPASPCTGPSTRIHRLAADAAVASRADRLGSIRTGERTLRIDSTAGRGQPSDLRVHAAPRCWRRHATTTRTCRNVAV